MPELRIDSRSASSFVGTYGPLLVSTWDGTPDREGFSRIQAATEQLLEEHGRTCALTILRGHVPMSIEPEARKLSEEVTRRFRETNVAGCVVISAEGMRASFMRTVLAGINIVARNPAPMGVTRTVEEGIDFLARHDPRLDGEQHRVVTAVLNEIGQLADER